MPFREQLNDRERDKFIERPSGETSTRVWISNEDTEPVPVSGTFSASGGTVGISAPTGPFKITTADVTDVAANPIPLPLSNRFGLAIRNRSQISTVYVGTSPSVTPDDTATGGWEVGPNEDFHLDLNDSNAFYLICPSGETAKVKILEIASIGAVSSGGGGSLTRVQEIPAGLINGSNVTYTLTQAPISAAYFKLFRSGVLLIPGVHYARLGNTITMVVAPGSPQTLFAEYDY